MVVSTILMVILFWLLRESWITKHDFFRVYILTG